MISWMAERDRLLAQTKAFVKEVAAAHPKLAPDLLRESLRPGPPRSDAGLANVAPERSKDSSPHKGPLLSAEDGNAKPFLAPSENPAPQAPLSPSVRITPSPGESDNGIAIRSSQKHSNAEDAILTIPRVATSERDDIAIRVSHFREHQKRLSREREQFSEQVRARLKSLSAE